MPLIGQRSFRPRPVNPVIMAFALMLAASGGAAVGLFDGNSAAEAQALSSGAVR